MSRPFGTIEEARRRAKRRLPRVAFDYIDGGAEDELTLRANRRAFEAVSLHPRYLVDVADRSLATAVCGETIELPVILAPTGLARMAGRDGDLAAARAATRAGTVHMLSTMSSHSIEDVTAGGGGGSLWFQLYLWRQRDVVDRLVDRAEAAGYRALVVTVDVPTSGQRERDMRNGFVLPPRLTARTAAGMLRRPRWLRDMAPPIAFQNFTDSGFARPSQTIEHGRFFKEVLSNPRATFDDLTRLRERWHGPLLVKGTLTVEDAERSLACGVDGIVVSNHGGRQLDGAPASLTALPAIVEAVGDRADVLLDSGIRRGPDVVKALALGAKACVIGRPWLYGLAAEGERGVDRVLDVLREEIDRTLVLTGRRSVAELDRSVVGMQDVPVSATA